MVGGGGLKVTVQFETEGSGQNEIVSRMDRQEVKLQNLKKKHTQKEILKQKNFTGSRLQGTPKVLKDFSSILLIC